MSHRYKNEYILLEKGEIEIDLSQNYDLGWGFDYYIEIFKQIEAQGLIEGLRLYLSYDTPVSIPCADEKTVLFIIADEKYVHAAYLNKLLCIFRCIGPKPVYLDGPPTTALKRAALMHFCYKTLVHLKSKIKARKHSIRLNSSRVKDKTVHLPLGVFRTTISEKINIGGRSIDYAFLGSVNFNAIQKKWYHRLFHSPKILSRQRMLDALQQVDKNIKGRIWLSNDFEDSIKNTDDYISAMSDTKISIVPRGTSYETLRFFESARAGCVIICEKLPARWCYENHPGIEIEDWKQVPDIISRLLHDPTLLEEKSMASKEYWSSRCSERAVARYVTDQIRIRSKS